jgi:CRP-like cAMP-binding protein
MAVCFARKVELFAFDPLKPQIHDFSEDGKCMKQAVTPAGNRIRGTEMTRVKAEYIVSESGWLTARPAGFRNQLLGLCQLVRFKKGAAIYRSGDPPGGVYGLIEGFLRVELAVGGAGEQVGFIAQPGFWIGVRSAILRARRTVTLISASPASLFYLPPASFELLAASPESMRQLATLSVENSDLVLAGARDLMIPDIAARIAARLSAIFGHASGSTADQPSRPVAITQADLAMMCNVSRKTINHELAKLQEIGLVSLHYGKLVVNDVAGLRRIADGETSGYVHRTRREGGRQS